MSDWLPWLFLSSYAARRAGTSAIERHRRRRLARIVAFARTNSPYYGELYRGLPDRMDDPTLLPITNKKNLMARFDDSVTDREVRYEAVRGFTADPSLVGARFLGKYRVATTSGATGTPGVFVLDHQNDAVMRALLACTTLSWLDLGDLTRIVSSGGRTATIVATGGHFAAASRIASLKLEDSGRRSVVFSAHTPLPKLVNRLNQLQPAILRGYASILAILAGAQESGRLNIHPVLVLPMSEGLTESEYNRVARAFNAKVRAFYGGTECGMVAEGCQYHWLHLKNDWVLIEPVDKNFDPVGPGEQSHTVLISNLANRVQPILRYDMGDSVLVRPDRCPCGDTAPAIRVHGRVADVLSLVSQNGRQVKIAPLQLATLVDRTPGVQSFQIIQTSPSTLRVRLRIRDNANTESVWQSVVSELQEFLETNNLADINIERATELPAQSESGKTRAVIPLS